jgi:hypothetical protein
VALASTKPCEIWASAELMQKQTVNISGAIAIRAAGTNPIVEFHDIPRTPVLVENLAPSAIFAVTT